MGFVFDVLIPAIIILAIGFIWLRTLFSQFLPKSWRPSGSPAGRVPGAGSSPRSFTESGGTFESAPPGRMARHIQTSNDTVEDVAGIENRAPAPLRSQRERPVAEQPLEVRGDASEKVRRALGSPASIRTSFIVKEVIDPPITMRDA